MSGCLDNTHCPTWEIDLGEKRNTIASVVSGGLVSICIFFEKVGRYFRPLFVPWLKAFFRQQL